MDATPAQPADVPPPAPVPVGDASEEETEVLRHHSFMLNCILIVIEKFMCTFSSLFREIFTNIFSYLVYSQQLLLCPQWMGLRIA